MRNQQQRGFDSERSSGDRRRRVDNQVITYVASSGQYEPRAGSGVTAGMAATKYSSDFNWSQSPSTSLATAGAKTVNLAACVAGVQAAEPQYYVYIAGTGTAEAVLVTGGTATATGLPGTLQFTTVNAHPSGYTIGSASSGLQEALIVARFTPTNPTGQSQSGKVVVPPGEYRHTRGFRFALQISPWIFRDPSSSAG